MILRFDFKKWTMPRCEWHAELNLLAFQLEEWMVSGKEKPGIFRQAIFYKYCRSIFCLDRNFIKWDC